MTILRFQSLHPDQASDAPLRYQITLQGHLQDDWIAWFEAQDIKRDEDGNSVLYCQLTDQAALYALLRKIRDLGIPLISIKQLPSES